MSRPVLSIIVPTIGRTSLGRLLESIPRRPDIEVLLIADTHGLDRDPVRARLLAEARQRFSGDYPWFEYDGGFSMRGNPQRNYGMQMASGQWLAFSQDDNVFEPGAVEAILATIQQQPHPRPLLFRVQTWRGPVLWLRQGRLDGSNLSGDCIVTPNSSTHLGQWGTHWFGGYDFILQTATNYKRDLGWVDQVAQIARPEYFARAIRPTDLPAPLADRGTPTFSFLVPTHDPSRPLTRCLDSIAGQLGPHDEVLVVRDTHLHGSLPEVEHLVASYADPRIRYLEFSDGRSSHGHEQINFGMAQARGEWLAFNDDDDVWTPHAVATMRLWASKSGGRPLMFRFKAYVGRRLLWLNQRIVEGDVGGHCLVCPNIPGKVGRWGARYEGDYDMIASTVALHGGADAVVWRPEVIAISRPTPEDLALVSSGDNALAREVVHA